MTTPTTGARGLAIVSGAALVAAAAWLTIDATGGPATPHAKLVAATAIAVVAGAVALSQTRGLTFVALALGLLAAEGYGLIATAERLVAAREAAQAPRRAEDARRDAAATRVARAEAAAASAAAHALADAAKKDCQKNCRALLEQAKADAADELARARAAIEALPPAADAAPLAARLGLQPWALDLIAAALGSLAANGLGCALIAFAVHSSVGAPCARPAHDFRPVIRVAEPEGEPESDDPGPGKPAPLPANVTDLAAIRAAIEQAGGELASNRQLARLMGVTEGEASKRKRNVAAHLEIVRDGRQHRIRLKRAGG